MAYEESFTVGESQFRVHGWISSRPLELLQGWLEKNKPYLKFYEPGESVRIMLVLPNSEILIMISHHTIHRSLFLIKGNDIYYFTSVLGEVTGCRLSRSKKSIVLDTYQSSTRPGEPVYFPCVNVIELNRPMK